MSIYEHIRNSRAFSYIMAAITIWWLSEALQWAYSTNLGNLSVAAAGLITGVITALVGLMRFIFTFASHKVEDNSKGKLE